jgi:Family of unknown function (DUF6262)
MSAQPAPLAEFQRQRSADRREAVLRAIRELDAASAAINVAAVAARAGVDRSYIYDHPDLFAEVRRLRDGDRPTPTRRPVAERASEASLQARLASAHEEITRLRAENRELRRRLEEALGDRWDSDLARR